MSVHLVGGGRDLELARVLYGAFVSEASARARGAGRVPPRIGVVLVAEPAGVADGVAWFTEALSSCAPVAVEAATATEDPAATLLAAEGTPLVAGWFDELDGLLVGGGLTPAYHRVLQPYAAAIRAAVRAGLPYAGFSAGAMVASNRALLGGWRLGDVAVTHEDNAEDLDQLTVVDGLGLVARTVEVHTAQWGTLSRVVAAADAGRIGSGMAIDENTLVIVEPTSDSSVATGLQVRGAGQVWLIDADVSDGQVRVGRRTAD